MLKYIHDISEFPEIFEKLKFQTEKYWAPYVAMLFELKNSSYLYEFSDFLLKYLRISDTVICVSKTKLLVILEETTIRASMILNERLRDKIKEKWFNYDYYCASIQWNFIDSDKALLKALKKRLKKSHECKNRDCISELSYMDRNNDFKLEGPLQN